VVEVLLTRRHKDTKAQSYSGGYSQPHKPQQPHKLHKPQLKKTIMKKFMLDIKLEGLDTETRMSLLPREQELVKEMEENGTIVNNFIKLDMSGIYIVMMAEDIEDVHTKLSTLPYYPYMKIVIVPVRVVNHINQ